MGDGTQKMQYKGQPASVLMTGLKQKVAGWRGELFVAVIQYGPKESAKFDVVADSTDPADVDDLPEVKTFDDYSSAVAHFMKLEKNKDKWKS